MYVKLQKYRASKTKSKKVLRLITDRRTLVDDHTYTIVGQSSILTNQGIPQFQKSKSIRIRMKNLWCRVLQSQYGQVSSICPHCPGNKHESQGHILGGCGHPTMKSMIIKRHGQAVHHIATALRNGPNGSTAIFLDAETEEHSLPSLPQWFPTAPPGHKSKPDIILFPGVTTANQTAPP